MEMISGSSSASASCSSNELLQAQAQVWNSAFNYVNSMSLKCAVELGIPEIVHSHGQPVSLSQLASALKIQPNKSHCVRRLMRILVQSGYFAMQEDCYTLTPASRLLLRDEPLKAAPFLLLLTHPVVTAPFNFLTSWFQQNDDTADQPATAFETAHGVGFWDLIARDNKFSKVFYDAMASDSELIASVVIKECKDVFKGINSLVDVGGGTGATARALAEAFPEINCTVLDLPHIVDNLQGTKNMQFQGGDMFKAIPPADAILLKWIMHDWGDEECVKILKECKKAIASQGKDRKVIVIDMVIIENYERNKKEEKDDWTETQLCFDMTMMTLLNVGKERTVKEWKKLFIEAGFSHYKIIHILGVRSLIEAYP